MGGGDGVGRHASGAETRGSNACAFPWLRLCGTFAVCAGMYEPVYNKGREPESAA